MTHTNSPGAKEAGKHRAGLLIAFEGIDGTGKTTQIRLLAEKLTARGHRVVATREPTDGKYGRKIRELFTKRHHVSAQEELDLFIADRKEHVREVIAPALAAGKIVLTDRYYFSTAAYQGAAGQDPEKIIKLNQAFAVAGGTHPNRGTPHKNTAQGSAQRFRKRKYARKGVSGFCQSGRRFHQTGRRDTTGGGSA